MTIRMRLLLAVTVLAIGWFPKLASAQIAEPTDEEFLAWPSYCQARYVTIPMGEASHWATRISRDQVAAARAQIGEATFLSVHHACAGWMWLNRARYEMDPVRRKFAYAQVISEMAFSLPRTPKDSILLTDMYAGAASASAELGKGADALAYLQQAIDTQPTVARPYIAMAILQRKSGDLKSSRATLAKGIEALGGSSPELDYNMGLILLDLKENAQAVVHARKAYAAGYPLDGLKNRLKRMGLWQESESVPQAAPR